VTSKIALAITALFVLTGTLPAQTPASGVNDPLGRSSPQASIFQFLEACHSRDYAKAVHFLDLRGMSPADRAKNGPALARQLEDLLDDTGFDIATLSRNPEGDQSDGLGAAFEHLDTFKVAGKTLDLQLERVEPKSGVRIWVVSAASVAMIPTAHQILSETPFEKKLPQQLVTFEILDTPVWRWIALIVTAFAVWFLASAIAWVLVAAVRSVVSVPLLRSPLRLTLATAGFRIALEFAPPSPLPRLFLERAAGLGFALGLAWTAAVVVDLIAERWHGSLDPRVQAISYSVLPLGRQIFKLSLYLIALLSVVSAWGYSVSTVVAGIGVGGIAVALAAQKTIENLFGGVSVISDRPVLVGDVCRFGDHTGTVIHIGLRSTSLRTADRTVINVPNGQFSSMALENISSRNKIWFHPILNLRRDTTSEQLSQLLAAIREILAKQPKVELGQMPVRFIGVGEYSLDVEVGVYVLTSDYNEFLAVQQDLLLQLLQAVERAGTSLAVPWQENPGPKTANPQP
jgi:MscS family membrane protein